MVVKGPLIIISKDTEFSGHHHLTAGEYIHRITGREISPDNQNRTRVYDHLQRIAKGQGTENREGIMYKQIAPGKRKTGSADHVTVDMHLLGDIGNPRLSSIPPDSILQPEPGLIVQGGILGVEILKGDMRQKQEGKRSHKESE